MMNVPFLQRRKKRFVLTTTMILIIVNVAIFLSGLIFMSIFGQEKIYELFALKPALIVQGQNLWTLVTSIFLHANFAHLFFNMISLFFVGTLTERIIGKRRFILFYFAAGIFASLFFGVLAGFFGTGFMSRIFGSADVFGVGASGAIFGIVGILAILIPKKKIFLIVGPLLAIVVQSVLEQLISNEQLLNVLALIFSVYIFFSIFTIFSFNRNLRKFALPLELPFWMIPIIAIVPLVVIGLFVNLPIGNMAHFGGLIAGLVYALYLKNKFKNKSKYIMNHFK